MCISKFERQCLSLHLQEKENPQTPNAAAMRERGERERERERERKREKEREREEREEGGEERREEKKEENASKVNAPIVTGSKVKGCMFSVLLLIVP
jgi:hypothetical protein